MLFNFSRQTFWAVFVPLTIVAGLFWLSEIRGYRAEMSILVLPKTEFAKGAAENLSALARELSFAAAVYETELGLDNPLTGKTVGERSKHWKETVIIKTSGRSDVIRLSVRGANQDEALTLLKAIVAEIVRTGSRYYNQKTDIDIRVIEEPATIPSFTEWPRFLVYTLGTALSFTVIFFLVHGLISRLFPKKPVVYPGSGEYVISPDTFKPRVPTYWNRDEHTAEGETYPLPTPAVSVETISAKDQGDEVNPSLAEMAPETDGQVVTDEYEYAEPEREVLPEEEILEERAAIRESFEETIEEVAPERVTPDISAAPSNMLEPERSVQYVEHAAAPDNLPIFDGPITPLQGAQARLMKLDIDATAEALSNEAAVPELNHTPMTHEPTPDEYKRRLNDLLSGKM